MLTMMGLASPSSRCPSLLASPPQTGTIYESKSSRRVHSCEATSSSAVSASQPPSFFSVTCRPSAHSASWQHWGRESRREHGLQVAPAPRSIAPAWRQAGPRGRRPIAASLGTQLVCAVGTAKPLRRPAEELSGSDLDSWQATVGRVTALGFEDEEAGKLVARAFGWILRGYWGDKIVDVVPTPEGVDEVLSYLRELGLEGADLQKVVKAFPYVLACSVEKRLKVNVAQLDRDWSISGAALTRSILRKPILLGYSVDCRGDCISECDLCWARF